MASAFCVLSTESTINDRFTYNNRFSALTTKNHTVSMQTDEIMLLNQKRGSHQSPPKKRKGVVLWSLSLHEYNQCANEEDNNNDGYDCWDEVLVSH